MVYLAALVIFLLLTTATWFVGLAVQQSLAGGPDLRRHPYFVSSTCVSILLVTRLCFVPYPWGYLLSPCWEGKRCIAVVTACLRPGGGPTFAFNQVAVTQREAENGIHFYRVEADLLEGGYEGPFVHFDEDEAPPFLHPAVRQHLGLTARDGIMPVAR